MKGCHTLICFFLLTGNTGLLTAGHRILTKTEGESVTVACSFTFYGDRKFFCKRECKEDILVETTGDGAENGRYRIEYSKTFFLSYPVLYVSITKLLKSDSGWYSCGLGRPLFPDSQEEFEIIVRDAPAASNPNRTLGPSSPPVPSASTPAATQSLSSSSGRFTSSSASPETTQQSGQQQPERTTAPAVPASNPNWTLGPSSPPVPSASTPAATQSLSSSSGRFTSSSASPETTQQSGQQQPERTTAPAVPGALLYVGLIVVVMVFLLSLAWLLFCKKAGEPKKPPVESEYASVIDANRVHEDIREDRQSRAAPVEISSFHTFAKYTRPNGVETTDVYSSAASSQNTVDFPNSNTPLLDSAPADKSNHVVSSDASHKDDTPLPLHYAITFPQQ